jgi:hypothetical protein
MFKSKSLRIGVILFSILAIANACRKKDTAALPDNLVNFEVSAQGIGASENSIVLKLKLSRSTDRDIPVAVNLTPQGLVYGTDFTTSPAAVSNAVAIIIPSGNNEASVTISKVAGALFDGDEKIVFDIHSSAAPVLIGAARQFTLSFSELIANNTTATINGGGPAFPNKVFIDLSANRQTNVLRTNWDLGFYTGDANEFRVVLNSSTAMMAKEINKTDLNAVTAADTAGFSDDVFFNQTDPKTAALAYIDYPNGDLSKTAIASISATAADNKVYIINRGNGVGSPAPARGWKKIRITRNGGGYTLQHADIGSTTFSSIDIAKDDNYFFKYVSFENGAVTVEPEKKKWDFAWTYFSNVTNFGTGEVPYTFQDFILQNRNVEIAKVLTSAKTFVDFVEADIATQSFVTTQTGIGSDWRSGGGPGVSPSVRTDRYYIIKDGDNNYYKLRFTALTQNGERGYPAYESVLIKKG